MIFRKTSDVVAGGCVVKQPGVDIKIKGVGSGVDGILKLTSCHACRGEVGPGGKCFGGVGSLRWSLA